jgi:polar amino acid transport system substrate-binding protein/glutamate/aspartate transport system substrate-binding protein
MTTARWILAGVVLVLAATTAQAQTLERIARDGTLRIGHRDTAIPFSHVDATTGEPRGYSVALCEAMAADIAAAAGVETLDLAHVPVTAADRFDAVAEGRVDLLCGAATRTLARRELVDFSLPTFVDGAGIALPRGGATSMGDLAGGTIAVTGGTTTEEALRRTLARLDLDAAVLTVADHDAGLAALREDRAQAYFADRAILLYLTAARGADDVVVADDQFTIETHALALARGDADFRLAVDAALSRLYLSGEVKALFAEAFGPEARMTDLLASLYRLSALPR